MNVLDLFSDIGCHAIGFERAGFKTVAFCESNMWRNCVIAHNWPRAFVYTDIRKFDGKPADIIIGGPPCQKTSVAAAIHGKRSGASLWRHMLRICKLVRPAWVVVEQPPGHAAWETKVTRDLCRSGWHVGRFEFGACDVGAPYLRRRVFLVACTSLPRLALARSALPSAIECVKRAADARGDWDPDQLTALRVDARSAGEMDRPRGLFSFSSGRKDRIEALGDANPPHMAEVIGRAILAGEIAFALLPADCQGRDVR